MMNVFFYNIFEKSLYDFVENLKRKKMNVFDNNVIDDAEEQKREEKIKKISHVL